MKIKDLDYSRNLTELVELMHRPNNNLESVLECIKLKHLNSKKQDQVL